MMMNGLMRSIVLILILCGGKEELSGRNDKRLDGKLALPQINFKYLHQFSIMNSEKSETDHSQSECTLSILHFNDVYDIQPAKEEPKAGAAYFKALLDRYRMDSTLTLFSGDVFAPSLLSSEYQGENMVKPLNSFKIDLACFGNHDLDYDLEHVIELKNMTNFPWLLSNVFDKRTEKRLAEGQEYRIIEKGGYKIGIFSLAEEEWIDTLMPQYKEHCEYYPFLDFADYMIKQLKSEGCDLIIALTHMMKYNDIKLAKKYSEIDLILGGHDHLKVHEKINNTILVKSGSNFKNFNLLEIYPKGNEIKKREQKPGENVYILENDKITAHITLVEVNHQLMKIEPDPELDQYIHSIYSQFAERQERIACFTNQKVDLRFKTIRKEQNAFLEFLVSVYRHESKADCAFMNSGNFRADVQVEAGPMTYGVLTNVIEDQIWIKKVTGEGIIQGLENCVSMYPNLAGRYSSLSGIEFTWDCSKKPYERVLRDTVKINGEKINLEKIYRVAMHSFMALGGDGFTVFQSFEVDDHYSPKKNLVLISELVHMNPNLLEGFSEKYPNRISTREKDGQKILEVNLSKPKNVKMVGEPNADHH